MGSSQSAPASNGDNAAGTVNEPATKSAVNDEELQAREQRRKEKEASLSGIDLVNYKCRKKEKAYKSCVSEFYKGKFLAAKGDNDDQEMQCGDLFEVYRRCYLKGVQKEVWEKKGAGYMPAEGSMLAKFVEEEREED